MQWHRLFGLLLRDFFLGSPFVVSIEPDLSLQQQRLDVVVIRKGKALYKEKLPDGLDDLGQHNLITFKSYQDTLDAWTMNELIGHYVSYRKLVSPRPDDLLPASQFQLYAVSARYPHNLAQQVPWQEMRPGVYHCRWGTELIRVVVARQLPQTVNNAPLLLFTDDPELIRFGRSHFRLRSEWASSVLVQLFEKHVGEGMTMPYTMEDFLEDFVATHLDKISPDKQRKAMQKLTVEQLLQVLSPEQLELLRQQPPPAPTKPTNGGPGKRKRKPT